MQEKVLKNIESKVTTFSIKMHTILITIGPSGAGKTTFVNEVVKPSLESKGVRVAHVSSDEIRRELLGDDSLSKKDSKMLHASKAAFNLLNSKVDALTSYPINTDVVVVDSTGLSEDFRSDIKEIADKNGYNIAVVMFDYKGRQPYYEYLTDEESKKTTSRQIKYMREEVMSKVSKKTYREIYKVKGRDFENYKIDIFNQEKYNRCILPAKYDYVAIGDIHGCYDEFIALLEKNEFSIDSGKISHEDERKRIVLVGDLVDKGYNVGSVIDLVHSNLDMIYMTIGNHENFVYRYLQGDIKEKDLPPKDVVDNYFDSISLFEANEGLKQRFFEVVEAMRPFLKHEEDLFIVTHAPCDQKHLGKLGSVSERSQRTIVYPKEVEFDSPQDYLEAKHEFFDFFRKQSSRSLPVHLFGHVSSKGISIMHNKINLDSGAVSGGHLSSIIVNRNGKHFKTRVPVIDESKVKKKELVEFFFKLPKKIDIDSLESREKGRILYAAEGGVNFISGTVCPANKKQEKDEDGNILLENSELESLDRAIEYFRSNKVTEVVAQPKYMGSRSNIYLFKDPSKNYTTSRGGHIIKETQVDLTEAYSKLYDIPFIKESFDSGTEMFILDAEMLPWSAMGRGLIDRQFVQTDVALRSEVEFLKSTGFESSIDKIVNGEYKDVDFEKIQHKTSKKDLVNMLGSTKAETFKNIRSYMYESDSLDNIESMLDIYSRQIEIYGQDGDISFAPFSILKQVFEDGTEKLFFNENNDEIYSKINDDKCMVVNLENEEDIQALKDFYNNTTVVEEMEGIMLKPRKVYVRGVAPSIKVRNPRYLTIVYGPDYMSEYKLEKLIKRKGIRRKLEISINEWEIGKRLLEIPYNQISKENKHYIQAYGEMVVQEREERELDPRL